MRERSTGFGPASTALALAAFLSAPVLAQQGAAEFSLPKARHPLPMETTPLGIYGLEHTHVITGNMENCLRFYVGVLGFRQVTPIRDLGLDAPMNEMFGLGGKGHFRLAILSQPGGASYGGHIPGIEIWEITGVPLNRTLADNPSTNLQGKGYNAYRVKDLAGLIEKLRAAGVKTISKQVFVNPQVSGIYAVDPDGQIVELDQFPDRADEQ